MASLYTPWGMGGRGRHFWGCRLGGLGRPEPDAGKAGWISTPMVLTVFFKGLPAARLCRSSYSNCAPVEGNPPQCAAKVRAGYPRSRRRDLGYPIPG
jgi:hypothetical protein